MDHSELSFRNSCRKWHNYLEHCAKDGLVDETSQLLTKIKQYLDDWKVSLETARKETREAQKQVVECKKREASIYLRMRMLRSILFGGHRNE